MASRFLLTLAFAGLTAALRAQPLVVHEWGTFTSLQDENGRTLSGINTDDEPVPPFCHDLAPRLVLGPGVAAWGPSQGAPSGHREVTMRLETPVLYFHPPQGAPNPLIASVKVAFHGGWLTQFYPRALAGGFLEGSAEFENLSEETTGTLRWENLRIGSGRAGPETTDRVWTAPRAVKAATVTTSDNESEKFLFYRGVGHLACPLHVTRTADARTLECRAQAGGELARLPRMTIRRLWLASFRADGGCAFRSLPSIELSVKDGSNSGQPVLFSVPAEFAGGDYSSANLDKLRAEMRGALKEEGLFADEADALLNTWELSYFKSAGLRLFFMVPKAWTDFHLPLEISVSSEVKRAMVGRLELVTPAQRALLSQLAQAPTPTQAWVHPEVRNNWMAFAGTPPPLYRDLGRFRNALLLDEYTARPTASLAAFIGLNGLGGYGWNLPRPRVSTNAAAGPAPGATDASNTIARTSILSSRLAAAASRGEVDMVASLLAEGADANAEGYLRRTPLAAVASAYGQKDDKSSVGIARILLGHGARVDARDDDGVTALYHAVEFGKTNLVRFLLEKGADPAIRMARGSLKGRTPLHDAAARGRKEIVEALLTFKAPADAVDSQGATPLLLAEGHDHLEIGQMLRQALKASGQGALAEGTPGPTREAMRAIAKRIAEGDDAAYDELSGAARELYRGIDFQKEAARMELNMFKMKAAFDVLGEEAGKGNDKAMGALKRCLRDRSSRLSSFAPDALGIAAAAGQEEALDMLLHHGEWGVLESSAVFAMAAPASANRERAVEFMVSWLSNPQHHGGGMALSATEALKQAADKGNAQARAALAKYREANPEPR
jgi:ankyrin repeat protein